MAMSSATKYLKLYVITPFEERVRKVNLAKFKVCYAMTHLTEDVQRVSGFLDRIGEEAYDHLDIIDKKTYVLFTNVEIACNGIRLTQKSKVS